MLEIRDGGQIPEELLREAREITRCQPGWLDSAHARDVIARALMAARALLSRIREGGEG